MEPIHPVIVIADMHFGYRDTKIKKESFMSLMSMAHLAGAEVVFLGDTFDLWRRKDSEIMEYNKECLDCISVDATFISGNHDLTICGQESYHIYGKNKLFSFIHGHQLEVATCMESIGARRYSRWSCYLCGCGNTLGGILSMAWRLWEFSGMIYSLYNKYLKRPEAIARDISEIQKLADNKIARNVLLNGAFLPTNSEFVLIYGHTHQWKFGDISINVGAFGENGEYLLIDKDGKCFKQSVLSPK